ncbi:hypothetical protein VTH82DRAFT_8367 [Thermothelomyces myriococcoides]
MASASSTTHQPSWDTNFSSLLLGPATTRDKGAVSAAMSRPSSGACAPTNGHSGPIDRFQAQHPIGDDAAPHGRMLGLPPRPHPDARVALYEARAARAIASFDAAFGRGCGGGTRSAGSGPGASGARL